jgi:macrodomain Ter protein organizer (MatP/YcbG family)
MSNGQFSSSILFNRSEPSAIAGVTENHEEKNVLFSFLRALRALRGIIFSWTTTKTRKSRRERLPLFLPSRSSRSSWYYLLVDHHEDTKITKRKASSFHPSRSSCSSWYYLLVDHHEDAKVTKRKTSSFPSFALFALFVVIPPRASGLVEGCFPALKTTTQIAPPPPL